MFIGHLGAGLALKKMDRDTNLGWFMASVMLLDLLLWIFVLLKLEYVIIPDNYSDLRYLSFSFPFSHSVVATLCWSALTFVIVVLISGKYLTAGLLSLGVFSHLLLDIIAHPPQLPLMGEDSFKMGLSLWNNMPAELSLEFLLLAAGLYAYLHFTTSATAGGKYGMIVLMVFLMLAAFLGQWLGPAPQSATQVAFSSLFTIVAVILLTYYLDRKRIPKPV